MAANECLSQIQKFRRNDLLAHQFFEAASSISCERSWLKPDADVFEQLKLSSKGLSAAHAVEVSVGLRTGALERLLDYLALRLVHPSNDSAPVGDFVINVYQAWQLTPDAVASGLDAKRQRRRLRGSRTFSLSNQTTRADILREKRHARSPAQGVPSTATRRLGAAAGAVAVASCVIGWLASQSTLSLPWSYALTVIVAVTTANTMAALLMSAMDAATLGRAIAAIDLSCVGLGEDTAIVVPVLLHPASQPQRLCELVLANFAACDLPNALVVVLTDFADSADGCDSAAERAQLDEVIGCLEHRAKEVGASWALLHRNRVYCPRQGICMGSERKRGKIELLNRAIMGERDLFDKVAGASDRIAQIEYVLVVDEDSQLAPHCARELLAAAKHPFNAPRSIEGRITGYGIFAPTQDLMPLSRGSWRFSQLLAGGSRRSFLFDVFGERQYSGKGLYRVSDFTARVSGKIKNDTVLSHDVVEGFLARTCHVQTALVVEPMPRSYASWCERSSRWMRGDFQNLFLWLSGARRWAHQRPAITTYYALLALRRADQVAFPLVLLAAACWCWEDGRRALCAIAAFSILAPAISSLFLGLPHLSSSPHTVFRYLRSVGQWIVLGIIRVLMSLQILLMTLDAGIVSTIRFVTGKKVLAWRSASAVDAAGTRPRAAKVGSLSSALAAAGLAVVLIKGVGSPPLIALLLGWSLFPLISERLFLRAPAAPAL